MLKGVDAMILGANTYKMFVEYWPTEQATEAVAEFINTKPKHVFSSSLASAPWGRFAPATLERGDLVETVTELRERYAGNLIVWGSLKLASSLFRAGLVDELRLRSVPVLIGEGKPIAPGDRTIALTLAQTKAFPQGHVVSAYRVASLR